MAAWAAGHKESWRVVQAALEMMRLVNYNEQCQMWKKAGEKKQRKDKIMQGTEDKRLYFNE